MSMDVRLTSKDGPRAERVKLHFLWNPLTQKVMVTQTDLVFLNLLFSQAKLDLSRMPVVFHAFLPQPKIPDIPGSLPSRDLRSVHGSHFLEASGAGDGSRQVTPNLSGKSRGQRDLAKLSNKHSMWSVSPDTGVSGGNLVVWITNNVVP